MTKDYGMRQFNILNYNFGKNTDYNRFDEAEFLNILKEKNLL